MTDALRTLEQLLADAAPYLILAPPRSSSTALARALLHHTRIGPYLHEPCDRYRHQGAPPASIVERLQDGGVRRGALIKEMTFQLGKGAVCRCFLRHARPPLVFLIRDPRRTVASRLRMVLRDLARLPETPEPHRARIARALDRRDYRALDDLLSEAVFPLAYTGWSALEHQVATCRRERIGYVILPAHAFRAQPRSFLEHLCRRWGLTFEESMLAWHADDALRLGSLAEQNAWYRRVVESTSVLPETDAPPDPACLPRRFRRHLPDALRVYRATLDDPHLLAAETVS